MVDICEKLFEFYMKGKGRDIEPNAYELWFVYMSLKETFGGESNIPNKSNSEADEILE